MTKVQTSIGYLLKYILLVSTLTITLSACESKKIDYSILFYDMDTYETIGNVSVSGIYDKTKFISNEKGYLNMPWQVSKDNAIHVSLLFSKDGYVTTDRRFMHAFGKDRSSFLIELIDLRKGKADAKCDNCLSSIMPIAHKSGNSLYEDAKKHLEIHKRAIVSK